MRKNRMAKSHQTADRRQTPLGRRMRNLGLAAVAGQAGCITLIIVFSAMFLGLWLDAQFDQRGPFTFGLLLLSVPVSLYAMLRIALVAISKIDLPVQQNEEPSIQDTSSGSKEV